MQNEREKDLIIEARFHRQLIGPKGENIQKIREEFEAVQISFPDLGSKSDIVKLRGPHDDVEKCGKQLTKLYKELLENNYQVNFTKIISETVISEGFSLRLKSPKKGAKSLSWGLRHLSMSIHAILAILIETQVVGTI